MSLGIRDSHARYLSMCPVFKSLGSRAVPEREYIGEILVFLVPSVKAFLCYVCAGLS